MRRFQVPQFIEVEDKLFGPLTLKQFIYVLGGTAIVFIAWISLPLFLVIFLGVPVMAFSLGLAFYKVNGEPLLTMLAHAVQYLSRSRLYLWRKEEKKQKKEKQKIIRSSPERQFAIPRAKRGGELSDLSWSLDVKQTLKEKRSIPQPIDFRTK